MVNAWDVQVCYSTCTRVYAQCTEASLSSTRVRLYTPRVECYSSRPETWLAAGSGKGAKFQAALDRIKHATVVSARNRIVSSTTEDG